MPGARGIQERFSTLGNMQEDGSYQGRVEIYQSSVRRHSDKSPWFGTRRERHLWSNQCRWYGNSVRNRDAGYAEILITYGWIGAGLIIYAMWRMWQEMAIRYRIGLRTTEVMLGRAFLLALIPACFVGNVITQFSILWIVFGAALDPHTLRVYVAKLRLMRDARRPKGARSDRTCRIPSLEHAISYGNGCGAVLIAPHLHGPTGESTELDTSRARHVK